MYATVKDGQKNKERDDQPDVWWFHIQDGLVYPNIAKKNNLCKVILLTYLFFLFNERLFDTCYLEKIICIESK